tara:strand:- start:412 stop:651 length:240 start_codon:yes stop_codon:yes gene_type:complete
VTTTTTISDLFQSIIDASVASDLAASVGLTEIADELNHHITECITSLANDFDGTLFTDDENEFINECMAHPNFGEQNNE